MPDVFTHYDVSQDSTLESVSPVARIPCKAVGPMNIGRVIPEHVKDPRAPVDKSRVLILGVPGQIPELLRQWPAKF